MQTTKLQEIQSLGENFSDVITKEKAVLKDLVSKTRGALRKRYNFVIEEGQVLDKVWKTADLMVKINKYHLVLCDDTAALIVYKRLKRGGFEGRIAACGWKTCREKVNIDEIIEEVIKALSCVKSQISHKTQTELNRI